MQFFKILIAMTLCYVTANADVGKENVDKQETEKLIVKKGVIYEKYEKTKQESKESALFGKFAISGNAIVFSKSKSLENNGQLYGFLEAKGDRVFDNTLEGAVVTDGEGNGVASTAFSSFANKKGEIDRKIPELMNGGVISGGADLQGGEAEVHGAVEGTATGNGVVLYGLADYGMILGSDGAGGSIGSGDSGKSDGKAGASKMKAKEKQKDKKHKDKHKEERKGRDKYKDKYKEKHKQDKTKGDTEKSKQYMGNSGDFKYGKSNLDGKAGASAGGGINNSIGGMNPYNPGDPLPKIEESDFTGKSAVVTLENLENHGQISGGVYAKTSEGYIRSKSNDLNGVKVPEHMQPQWRSILLAASGNGVAAHTFVTSPTRQNFSTESQNKASIGNIHNSGEIKGKGDFVAGNMATINYTNSFAVANGISLSAYSDNNVGHRTETNINEVDNHGKISGNLKQRAGENTGSGWHEYSDATAVASGNGISLISRSSNAKNKMTEAHIKSIKNDGVISGELDSRAGIGNGQIINTSKSSGNGIALYALGGQQRDTSIDSISNKGIISGKAVIYGGKDTAAAYSGKEEKRFHVEIKKGEGNSLSSWLYPENSTFSFTEEEKKKGTEVFKDKQEKEEKKIEEKLQEFRDILEDTQKEYERLKEKVEKKKELLEKIRTPYCAAVGKEIADLEQEYKKTEENCKWLSNQEESKQKMEKLKEDIKKLEKEKENVEQQRWEEVEIEKCLKFYDGQISIYEEKIDKAKEEGEKKLNTYRQQVKSIEHEMEREVENKYHNEEKKKQRLADLEKKMKNAEKTLLEKEEEERQKFLSEKQKIDMEISKLKGDLKDEEVQEFLTVLDRKESSEATIKHLEKLKEENMKRENPMTKPKSHASNTIHTEVFVHSSGNGISIHQEGSKIESKESLKNFENEGVISGYTEVYHGNDNQTYSRVSYRSSGAGLSIKGKMKSELKNAGILSGNEFAILAEGTKNDAYSMNAKYESGFDKVSNYGILAGKVIVGGYAGNSASNQDYDYFETRDSDKLKQSNHGLYLVLDEKGEVSSVVKGDQASKYGEKDIINLEKKEDTHKVDGNNVENKVVNGVGEEGVISTEKEVTIDNSIINGFYKAVKVGDHSHAVIRNSIINSNGFGNRSYAVVGTDGENELTIEKDAIINGKIDLGKGNDRLNIKDGKLLSDIDLGEGYNTLAFKENTKEKEEAAPENSDVYVFQGRVKNTNNLEIERNVKIAETAKISGVETLNIAKGKTLTYAVKNKSNQAFEEFKHQEEGVGIVNLEGEGNFLLDEDSIGFSKAGDSKDMLGWELRRQGNRVYIESQKIYETRKYLGMSLSELQEMAEGKEIRLYDAQTLLSNLYKNPRAAYSYAIASNVSSYYKLLVATEKFIPERKLNAIVRAWKFENAKDGYKTDFLGRAVKVNYGLSEHINLGLNIGNGRQKIRGKSSSLKQDVTFMGMEMLWKKNQLSWNNGFSYGKADTKNGADASVFAGFSAVKYEIPLSKNWFVVPQASVLLARMSQKAETQKVKNGQGKEIGEIYVPKQTQNYMEWDFGLSLFEQTSVGQHQFHFNIGMEYSMSKDLNSMRVTQSENFAGVILKNEWKWNSPQLRNTWVGFTGLRYQHENGISLDISLRRNNKNMRNSSLGIGYLF